MMNPNRIYTTAPADLDYPSTSVRRANAGWDLAGNGRVVREVEAADVDAQMEAYAADGHLAWTEHQWQLACEAGASRDHGRHPVTIGGRPFHSGDVFQLTADVELGLSGAVITTGTRIGLDDTETRPDGEVRFHVFGGYVTPKGNRCSGFIARADKFLAALDDGTIVPDRAPESEASS